MFRAIFASRYLMGNSANIVEVVDQVAFKASERGTGTIHGFAKFLNVRLER